MKITKYDSGNNTVILVLGVVAVSFLIVATTLFNAVVRRPPQQSQFKNNSSVKAATDATDPDAPAVPDSSDLQPAVDMVQQMMRFGPTDMPIDTKGPQTTNGSGNTGSNNVPGGQTSSVAFWAGKIAEQLSPGCFGYYNTLLAQIGRPGYAIPRTYPSNNCGNPGNLFWCADLVREAFYLAGYEDFVNSSYVPTQRNFFKDGAAGYYFIDYNEENGVPLSSADLARIKSGCAIMYGYVRDPNNDRGDHIEIINTVSVDANGNGEITTWAANSGHTSHTDVISGGTIIAYNRHVVGIGCHQ